MMYVVTPLFGIAAVKLIQFFIGITGFEGVPQATRLETEDYSEDYKFG
jgi:hypothetical protein